MTPVERRERIKILINNVGTICIYVELKLPSNQGQRFLISLMRSK